ncbi:MAG: energy-coupled thiamine transporter ThiT, partial [Lachnospiraceae bacterium]|nr:energy-coupled thiamine transporter ThiT [Lachnospiraceae bacterium]
MSKTKEVSKTKDPNSVSTTRILAECALMLAVGIVLSLVKLIDLPYGGSVTVASMLPVILISYRHGVKYGLITGLAYGIIQQLLGLNTLSYVTTWISIIDV